MAEDHVKTAIYAYEIARAAGAPFAVFVSGGNGNIQTQHTVAMGMGMGAVYRALLGNAVFTADAERVLLEAFRKGLENQSLAKSVQAELAKTGCVKEPT